MTGEKAVSAPLTLAALVAAMVAATMTLGAPRVAVAATLAPTDLDLKAAYCLEVDKHLLAELRHDYGDGAPPGRPNAQHAIDRMQNLTDHVRTYVATRLSESVDPTAIALAITRADADLKRLDAERPSDPQTLARSEACVDASWLAH
jgi:hypothetical protein